MDLVRIARDLYVPAAERGDLRRVCLAALESSASDTVVVSTTAARLYGLWLPPGLDEIHLATASPDRAGRMMTRTRRPELRAHRLQMDEDEKTVLDGVVVTTLARTWRDLAATLDVPALVAAGDRALQLGAGRDGLAAMITRRRNYRGARRARIALPLLDDRSRSRPESHMRVAISQSADLPRFEVNEPVYRRDGGWLAEPDLSLAEACIALEYQGEVHASRMRKDMTRFLDMRREGWFCVGYGPAETFGRPWEIAAETRAAVRERAPHLLRPRRPRRVVT